MFAARGGDRADGARHAATPRAPRSESRSRSPPTAERTTRPDSHHAPARPARAPATTRAPRLARARGEDVPAQACAWLPERRAPTLRCAQMLGQLIATRVAVELVLFAIDPIGLLEDLERDPAIISVRVARRVRDAPSCRRPRSPRPRPTPRLAQLQHPTEQLRQRLLVPDPELRDRRVIRPPVRRDHPIRDVLQHARSIPREERSPREYA